jgi:predicted secreted Zn-dependent protease
VTFYPVSGSTEMGLISSVLSGGPNNCGGEPGAAACFYHTFNWTYKISVDAQTQVCTVTSVAFTPAYWIVLPEWTSPAQVSPALAAWWRKSVDHFVWHESQHLAIAQGYVEQYKSAILAGPCKSADQVPVLAPITARLAADQDAFDASDRWAWPAM